MSPDYQEIRKLIERRFRRRVLFVAHMSAFIVTLIITAWYVLTQYVYIGDWNNLWYLAGWAIILVLHWGYLLMAKQRDQEIEQAWYHAYGGASADRMQYVPEDESFTRLSEDGEWMMGDIRVEKPKRRG